jgi:predicted RNase H-like HicB family nuclease
MRPLVYARGYSNCHGFSSSPHDIAKGLVNMPVTKCKFTVILELEEDGGYSVHCPALPGCVSQGNDRPTTLENIREAIKLVWKTLPNGQKTEVVRKVMGVLDDKQSVPPYKESPEVIAEEIRHILAGRQEDGLPFGGVSTETVEVELPIQVSA